MNKRNTFQSVNTYPSARLVMFSNRVPISWNKNHGFIFQTLQYMLYVYTPYTCFRNS